MAVIQFPTPGAHFSNGLSTQAGADFGLNISNAVYPIASNCRWQWNLTGAESTANAGSNLQLQAVADDGFTVVATAISVNRATGAVTITGGGATEYFADGTVSAPSIANTTNHGSGVYFTTNAVNVTANGVRALSLATATTGVNYLVATPAAAGSAVSLSAAGSDTDVGLLLIPKGAGVVALGGATAAASGLQVPITASAVNFLSVAGAATGSPVLITATGTDTNVPLTITAKGSGQITMGDTTSNVVLGPGSALATNAVAGHAAIPTCAGTPTGVPTGNAVGQAQILFDSSGTKLWVYKSGTGWVGVVVS